MKVKKWTALVTAMLAISAMSAFAACGNNDSNGGGNTVTLSGSTSVQPLMEDLAKAFEEKNKEISIQITGGGSSKGVQDAQKGLVDFGMVSRELAASETGVKGVKIATDGIALIVNENCALDDVTTQEIFDLYSALTPVSRDGQDIVTRAIARDATSGTRGAFDELIVGMKDGKETALGKVALADGISEVESTGVIKTTIASSGNSNMIGYISLGSVDDTIKTVSFNGVAATVANIEAGTYKLARPFNLVLKDGDTLSESAQAFYDFIMSAEGQTIVGNAGYIKASK